LEEIKEGGGTFAITEKESSLLKEVHAGRSGKKIPEPEVIKKRAWRWKKSSVWKEIRIK